MPLDPLSTEPLNCPTCDARTAEELHREAGLQPGTFDSPFLAHVLEHVDA